MPPNMASVPASASIAYVHVRVGHCDMAVPVADVRMAMAMPVQGLAQLPRRSGGLVGLVDMAGASIPIVGLDRWLPMEAGSDITTQRLLLLQNDSGTVGIRVDAILGVQTISGDAIKRIHHQPDENELFESVLPVTAQRSALCILEVARLMRLSQAWCANAEVNVTGVDMPATDAAQPTGDKQRVAVFQIGREVWCIPAGAVDRVVPLPPVELELGRGRHSWAISQWQGRKIALVDISAEREASNGRVAPWMVLLSKGHLALGLTVTACKQLTDLPDATVASTPDDALMAGVAILPELEKLNILDVDKLFSNTPEAAVSRMDAADFGGAAQKNVATQASAYLVFDADQRYASPVTGIAAVVTLPQQTRDDLCAGRPAALAWRGKTITIVNLPTIGKSSSMQDPQLAVLMREPNEPAPSLGIAIKALCDWLPAHSTRRQGLRMAAVGELSLINAEGAADHVNLVVVDLAQIAHMLG